ncbi:FIGNL1-interacting regulator of recombination and mitosis [Tiliqua scincoides]|uniref:FIGNL1-interacting regulator of recombination and mitosis n=1 Tax=Tiliqua scincoides TaxID=71010 RepID=UPI0034635833
MSQAEPEALALLTEVEGWGPELCGRQLSTALPRLLSVYQISDNWSQHICILRILTEKFLPHINLSELEQAFFSKILPKTVQLFDHLMYEISNQAKRLTSQNADLHLTLRNHLQAVGQLLETLTGCVRHICTKDMVPLEYIHSVPSSVLHVIKSTFIYCKDCESLYSDCLHLFSDLLQSLFKEAYVLQRQLMELLDTVSVDSCASEDSLAIMVSVIHTVLEICSAISSIDQALHANTWKFIIRQSLKHKSLIKDNLKHSDILSGLCEDILFSFQSSLQLAEQMKHSGTQESVDYKLFQRTIKLCRFFAVSLVRYTKEFTPFLVDSCSLLHQTYLQIYSKFPPSLYAPVISEAHRNEIVSGFLVALDPFVHQLLSFKPFVDVVLNKTLDLSPELHFPQCRLLLSVMDTLPSQPQDVQSLWNARNQLPKEIPRVPLFVALFLSLQQCSGELSLPVFLAEVTGPGQVEVPVTLYHYVCIHLCTFITSLPVLHFPLLEGFLLETILGSNMITALLAMDAWCFLARYGTADLCAQHAFIIAHLIKACPAECYQISLLGFLLRRLLFLMAADHQAKFTQKFLPKETKNLLLWQHLSLKALEPLLRKQVAHDLFVAGLAQCQDWLSDKRPLEELPEVNFGLSALLSMCQTTGEALEEGQQTALIETVGQLLTVLHATQISSLPCLQQTFCLMFRLLQRFIQKLQPQLLVQVFAIQTSLLQANPPDHVLFAVTDFLSSMGKLFIPSEFQIQVLSTLSCLFASLLASSNWLIHQHALEAFTQFAEETSHEDILPQCLNSEEIKSRVVCFLSKTHQVEETGEARVERLKEENALLKCHLQKAMADEQRALVLEPSLKRSCYSPNEAQYKSAIDTAEGTLETVKLLLQKGPPPTWLAKKLEVLQATLNSLKNSIQ